MGEGGLKRKVEYVVAEVVKGKSTTSRPHVAGFEFDRPNPNWVNSCQQPRLRAHKDPQLQACFHANCLRPTYYTSAFS